MKETRKSNILARIENTIMEKPTKSSILAKLDKHQNRFKDMKTEVVQVEAEMDEIFDTSSKKQECFNNVMDKIKTGLRNEDSDLSQWILEAISLRKDIVVIREQLDKVKSKFIALQDEAERMAIEMAILEHWSRK